MARFGNSRRNSLASVLSPGTLSRSTVFPYRLAHDSMARPHRDTDIRAGARQAFRQLLPAAANQARCSSMHAPAPSRGVLHCLDGRRVGCMNQIQFDPGPVALGRELLSVFGIEQAREHAGVFETWTSAPSSWR